MFTKHFLHYLKFMEVINSNKKGMKSLQTLSHNPNDKVLLQNRLQ